MAALTFSRVPGPLLPPPIEGQRKEPDNCSICAEPVLSDREAIAHKDARNLDRYIHHLHPECYQEMIDAGHPSSVDFKQQLVSCPSCKGWCSDLDMAPRMPLSEKILLAVRITLVATFILSAWTIPLWTPWVAHIGSLATCVVETMKPDISLNERIASVAQMAMTALFWAAIFYKASPFAISICSMVNFAAKSHHLFTTVTNEEVDSMTRINSLNRYVAVFAQHHALLPALPSFDKSCFDKVFIRAITGSILWIQRGLWPLFLATGVSLRLESSRLSNKSQKALALLTCALAFATLRSPGMMALYNQTPSMGAAYCGSPFLALPTL